MSIQQLGVFQGVDSTLGPIAISNVPFFPGDTILSVVTLSPTPDPNDWKSAFGTVSNVSSVIVQSAGHNFSSRTFLALIQRA